MSDTVLERFLQQQLKDGLALARESDILDVVPMGMPANRYLVHLTCTGLVRQKDGLIAEAHEFLAGIQFQAEYLRSADPFQVVTWLGPRNVWHPNIAANAPLICVGHPAPGTTLVDLIYQIWEIVTWNRVTMREDDALNHEACQWARANLVRTPIDTRPLKRRPMAIDAIRVDDGRDILAKRDALILCLRSGLKNGQR